MRKVLLAGVALFGATGLAAHAQAPANPTQGQLAAPYGAGPATNNNNNAWGIANTPSGSQAAGSLSAVYAPNNIAVPSPGTIVIRLNGRVEADVSASFTNADRGVGANAGYKLNPVNVGSYMRLYPGFDGVAANGLRYGAAFELRENFAGAGGSTTIGTAATNPSANSSAQTVFVRRAFTYLASDQAGILRLGQGDGVLGLFDNCIFTTQCWDAGITAVNGGGFQLLSPTAVGGIPWVWISQSGAEYANNKIVYLSPQFYGFDFGAQYAPNMGNGFQDSGLGSGCTQAGPTCISVSSGNDATRWLNQVGVGLRYQQVFGPVDIKAYGFYETAGKENLATIPYAPVSRTAVATTLRYDNLSFYKAGLAVTAANVTAAADYIGGAVNGALSMRPTGGVPTNAVITGLTYSKGSITLGAEIGLIDTQGDPRLTGVSQRHEYEIAFGGTYKVAPGLQLVAEYMYIQRHQGGYNFAQGALGATRDAKGQGLVLSSVLTW